MSLHLPSIAPEVVRELAAIGARASQRGWVPATSGNFSMRLDATHIAVTRSGIDKGNIGPSDVVAIALDEPLPSGVSAETPLHVARYRADARIGAILHVHTVAATVLSRANERAGSLTLQGYEMHKSLQGYATHESTVRLPVVSNAQDTEVLAERVERCLDGNAAVPGYLLAGHGLYVWGNTMADARRHLEGIDFLLQCELEERRH